MIADRIARAWALGGFERRHFTIAWTAFGASALAGRHLASLGARPATIVGIATDLAIAVAFASAALIARAPFEICSLPLYGRRLARLYVAAPASCAAASPVGFALGAILGGTPVSGELFLAPAGVVAVVTTLTLAARLRTGGDRALCESLAFGAGCAIVGTLFVRDPFTILATLLASGLLAYLGLRSLAETLGRYDALVEPEAGGPS